MSRRRQRSAGARPPRRGARVWWLGALGLGLVLVTLVWLGDDLLGALRRVGGPKPIPLPAYESIDGVRVARLDRQALVEWSRRQGLPDPPPIESAEPAVAETLLQALQKAAGERSAGAFGEVGRISESLDAHRAATEYFRLAADADPEDFRWPYHLGCVHQVNGEQPEAIAALEHARSLDPAYPVTYARLGELYLDGGREEEAEAMFRRYVQLRPDDWFGQVGLGRLALARGAAAEALRHLEEAAAIRAEDFQVQYNLGRAHAALGDRERARAHFARAAELPQGAWFRARDPLDQELHRSSRSAAGLVSEFERLSATGDWPRLAALAEEIVRRRSGDTTMLANLASIYRKMRRFEEAHAAIDRALALRPEDPRLRVVRAEIHLAAGSYAEALAAAGRTLELDPGNRRADAVRGRALLRLGRLAEAEEVLRRLTPADSRDVAGLFVLGEALRLQGKRAEAVGAYRRVLELEPGFGPARQQLSRLREDD